MMMQKLGKVTILGGTGFIGSQLAIKLSKLSSNIDVLTRNAESNQSLKMIPNLEIRQIDVTDERNLNLCFKDSDLVINTIGILNELDEDNTFDNIHYELAKKLTKALNANNIKKTVEGKVMDELKLNKICCRRHMLTHVDIIG